MSEKSKTIVVIVVAILFFLVLEAYDDYNQMQVAEYKCEQHRQSGWPNKDKKDLCDKWLPIIRALKARYSWL